MDLAELERRNKAELDRAKRRQRSGRKLTRAQWLLLQLEAAERQHERWVDVLTKVFGDELDKAETAAHRSAARQRHDGEVAPGDRSAIHERILSLAEQHEREGQSVNNTAYLVERDTALRALVAKTPHNYSEGYIRQLILKARKERGGSLL